MALLRRVKEIEAEDKYVEAGRYGGLYPVSCSWRKRRGFGLVGKGLQGEVLHPPLHEVLAGIRASPWGPALRRSCSPRRQPVLAPMVATHVVFLSMPLLR